MESPLILVIDDSPTIRKMVECHLSQAGYRVAMAPDAERGLETGRTIRPDLILLDHQLPGTTGDQVCRRLLEREADRADPGRHQLGDAEPGLRRSTPSSPTSSTRSPSRSRPSCSRAAWPMRSRRGRWSSQAQRTGCAVPEAVGEVRRRGPGREHRGLPAPAGARLPEQRPAARPALTLEHGQGPGPVRAWPGAGSRRSSRRRSSPTGSPLRSRPSWPTSPRCWP